MTYQTSRSVVRLLGACAGFGVLMGTTSIDAGFWTTALLASAAGAWFVLWWPFVDRAERATSDVVRWCVFVAGVAGFGVLMGLRDDLNPWTRALVAGAAMAWLVGSQLIGRTKRIDPRGSS